MKLKERHIRILELYAAGLNRQETVTALRMRDAGFDHYLAHIKDALGADTMHQALAIAIRRGIIA